MEKITKEELLEQLKLAGVSDEDLAKISGGYSEWQECMVECLRTRSWEACTRGNFCPKN